MRRCLWLLVVGACASQPTPPKTAASRPAHPEARSAAYDVAREVAVAAGVDQLDQVAELDFRFVVTEGDDRVFEAKHRWDLRNGRAHIVWIDREGVEYDAVLDVAAKQAVGTIDGAPAEGAAAEQLSEKAYARYINDTYWLLMPLKLFDPGTKLELLPPRTIEGEPHQILRLSFDGVGLTPGDVYTLVVNPEARRIVRWEMELEGSDGPPKGVSWEAYRPVGPLVLAHEHRVDGGDRKILFEETRALKTVDASAF